MSSSLHMYYCQMNMSSSWILPLSRHVTLGTSLNLFEPQVVVYKLGIAVLESRQFTNKVEL